MLTTQLPSKKDTTIRSTVLERRTQQSAELWTTFALDIIHKTTEISITAAGTDC